MKFTKMNLLKLSLISIALILSSLASNVSTTRLRLNRTLEPDTKSLYNNYRVFVIADRNLYHLKRANLLKDEAIDANLYEEDAFNHYKKYEFKFNSSEFFRKITTLMWFIPLEEKTAQQVFDSEDDLRLARGPQVNQEMCSLHLDYMSYLNNKHLAGGIDNITDLNMFDIMGSYDSPILGVSKGNFMFPGDYSLCKSSLLTVSRNELAEAIGQQRAAGYFANRKPSAISHLGASISSNFYHYVGPFIGIPRQANKMDLIEYSDDIDQVKMRYCFASVRWPSWPNSSYYRRNMAMRVATCLPETCDSSSLSSFGDKIKNLTDFKMSSQYHRGYYIDSLYCLPDEESPLRNWMNYKSTLAFVGFNLFWFLLIIVATIRCRHNHMRSKDCSEQQSSLSSRLLSSWCLVANIEKFLQPQRGKLLDSEKLKRGQKNKVNLEPLEIVKFISSVSIITSHACMVGFVSANWNTDMAHNILSNSIWAPVSVICPSTVDVFLAITGIITMKTLLETSKKILFNYKFWFQFVAYRYLRIVPMYLFVHWFLSTSFRFIGSGPRWDYGTSKTAWSHLCQTESYWNVLIPLANLKSPLAHCNHVGWYLASDLQYTLITPIIVLLYVKKPLFGHLAIGSSVLLSTMAHINNYYNNMPDSRSLFEWSTISFSNLSDTNSDAYTFPQYRCVAYLIGLYFGYVLYKYEQGSIKEWPSWFVTMGKYYLIVYSYLILSVPFITTLLPLDNKPLIDWASAVLLGTMHSFAPLATSIFVLLLCSGKLPKLNFMFNETLLALVKPMAGIALSLMLVHIPLELYHSQKARVLEELTPYRFGVNLATWTVESLILASIVYVVYELPMRGFLNKSLLIRMSLKNNQKDSKNTTATNEKKIKLN